MQVEKFVLKFVLKQILAIVLVLLVTLSSSPAAWAADPGNGGRLFEVHCAGCHAQGGNIIRRGKTLKLKALQRNQMDSIEAIAQLVTHGKANMSAYKDRLTPSEIQDVSAYVWEQAAQGWR